MSLAKPPAVESGWTQSNAPDLWAWDKDHTVLTGVLRSRAPIDMKGKRVVQLLFQVDGTHQVKCLETYDLSQKINNSHVGCQMRITYLGEDENVKRGDNAMKVFDVQFKRPSGMPARDSGPITDEDIPF
jgi:hypothetical protein